MTYGRGRYNARWRKLNYHFRTKDLYVIRSMSTFSSASVGMRDRNTYRPSWSDPRDMTWSFPYSTLVCHTRRLWKLGTKSSYLRSHKYRYSKDRLKGHRRLPAGICRLNMKHFRSETKQQASCISLTAGVAACGILRRSGITVFAVFYNPIWQRRDIQ